MESNQELGEVVKRTTKENKRMQTELLQQKAEQILSQAEKKGVQNSFFFCTTFQRYLTQLRILEDLEQKISELGSTVTKEYVKGRENICINPAITEYNKTVTSANNTVASLIKIIDSMPKEEEGKSLAEELNDLLK